MEYPYLARIEFKNSKLTNYIAKIMARTYDRYYYEVISCSLFWNGEKTTCGIEETITPISLTRLEKIIYGIAE